MSSWVSYSSPYSASWYSYFYFNADFLPEFYAQLFAHLIAHSSSPLSDWFSIAELELIHCKMADISRALSSLDKAFQRGFTAEQ